jgi:hypothetical protein
MERTHQKRSYNSQSKLALITVSRSRRGVHLLILRSWNQKRLKIQVESLLLSIGASIQGLTPENKLVHFSMTVDSDSRRGA